MKNKDFIAFPISGYTNPIILRKDNIESIVPHPDNQLMSRVFLLNSTKGEHFNIDEPTSSIEGRL